MIKYIIALAFCSLAIVTSYAQDNVAPTGTWDKVTTTQELQVYKGTAQAVLVTDSASGGIFYYSPEKHKADGGVVFTAAGKGYWIRLYNKDLGVNISWFGAKLDGKNSDDDALKRALTYPTVHIDGNMAVSGKAILPEGKTLIFSQQGALTVTDTFILKINSYLRADDYQHIFYGNQKLVFATTSVPYVSACWFGAVADCPGFAHEKGTDNRSAIQNAIYAAQKVSDVFIPPSAASYAYRISGTITLTKKLHFFSFRLHGGGTSITSGRDDKATNIFADFKDNPCLNVQGCRRVYIEDMQLHGLNEKARHVDNYEMVNGSPSVMDPGTFVTEGIKKEYAGIATDAEKENNTWSADIIFERLQIEGFYTGISISEAGHYQGDRMRVEKTQINNCIYGISIGNAQNRACHFLDVDMNHVWCGVTNMEFGNQTGSEFQITGGQWCHIYKLFHVVPYYLGQCVVSGLYSESAACIGEIGTSSVNNNAFLFTGCSFVLTGVGLHSNNKMYTQFYTLNAYANVSFIGCNLWDARRYMAFRSASPLGYKGAAITFTGCSICHGDMFHTNGNVIVNNTYMVATDNDIDYNRDITADFGQNLRYNTGYYALSAVSGNESLQGNTGLSNQSAKIKREIPRFFVTTENSGIKLNFIHHDTINISFSEEQVKKIFRYVLPGDHLGTGLKPGNGSIDNPTLKVLTVDLDSKNLTAIAYTDELDLNKIGLYTNAFFTTKNIKGDVVMGENRISHISDNGLLKAGDFITFAGAERAYRIRTVNRDDSSIILMDPIEENIDGTTMLFNEKLVTSDNTEPTVRSIKGNYEATVYDNTIVADASADVTVNLPADALPGHVFNIKKMKGAGKVTVTCAGCLIDEQRQQYIQNEYQTMQLQFDGKNYIILNK